MVEQRYKVEKAACIKNNCAKNTAWTSGLIQNSLERLDTSYSDNNLKYEFNMGNMRTRLAWSKTVAKRVVWGSGVIKHPLERKIYNAFKTILG